MTIHSTLGFIQWPVTVPTFSLLALKGRWRYQLIIFFTKRSTTGTYDWLKVRFQSSNFVQCKQYLNPIGWRECCNDNDFNLPFPTLFFYQLPSESSFRYIQVVIWINNNSIYLARKHVRTFILGCYLFRDEKWASWNR